MTIEPADPSLRKQFANERLLRARNRLNRFRLELENQGHLAATPADIDSAHDRLLAAESILASLKDDEYAENVADLEFLEKQTFIVRRMGIGVIGALGFAFSCGGLTTLFGIAILTFLSAQALITALFPFLCGIAVTMMVYGVLEATKVPTLIRDLEETSDWVEERAKEIADADQGAELAEKELKDLVYVANLPMNMEKARLDYEEWAAKLASLRFRQSCQNFRSMRDVEFEDFIAEVFEQLGHRVYKTKRSGDHGVDLIVTASNKRLAIQVKGYEGSVGVAAVQEARYGMEYYKCDCGWVVTNSAFTKQAEDGASQTGIRLVDGSMILDLIEGRIVPT